MVDDDPLIRDLCGISLELDPGLRSVPMASGQAALDGLAAEPQPDAILLDVMMPGLSGLETLRAIRSQPRFASLPVVLMTATDHSARLDLAGSGATAVLSKPFDPVSLAPVLLAHIEKGQTQ